MKIIIINGRGGSGKDTVVSYIRGYMLANELDYYVYNISSIDIIKQAARIIGWDGTSKTSKDRKFLSDLKRLSIDYNDFPTNHIINNIKYIKDLHGKPIIFIHIREPEEITKMVDNLKEIGYNPLTLFIDRDIPEHGNVSDDNLDYDYDYIIDNNYDFEITRLKMNAWLEVILDIYEIRNNKQSDGRSKQKLS